VLLPYAVIAPPATLQTTPSYRAPEMVDLYQRRRICEKADVWAMGCLMYKLVFFDDAFGEGGAMAILGGRFVTPPPPLSLLPPPLHSSFSSLPRSIPLHTSTTTATTATTITFTTTTATTHTTTTPHHPSQTQDIGVRIPSSLSARSHHLRHVAHPGTRPQRVQRTQSASLDSCRPCWRLTPRSA
jgi:serine/threonine protein kinase